MLHFANVATRELALAKAWKMGKPRQMFEGTTKNAHTQAKREIFAKNDRFHLSHTLYSSRSSSLESEVLGSG